MRYTAIVEVTGPDGDQRVSVAEDTFETIEEAQAHIAEHGGLAVVPTPAGQISAYRWTGSALEEIPEGKPEVPSAVTPLNLKRAMQATTVTLPDGTTSNMWIVFKGTAKADEFENFMLAKEVVRDSPEVKAMEGVLATTEQVDNLFRAAGDL